MVGGGILRPERLTLIDKIATTDAMVLIIGEPGTGKQPVAGHYGPEAKRFGQQRRRI
jgi:DNA-binding NtrC family response regulator